MSQPILSILIPTFNRSQYLAQLLRLFEESAIFRAYTNIEIVVANNCSEDATYALLNNFQSRLSCLQVIHYSDHVRTAEENVFRSFKDCRGEYIWVLGDDDIPIFQSLPTVIQELEAGTHDFLVFNSPIIGRNSKITNHAMLKMNSEKYSADIREIALSSGFWFVLAGMSGQILRASCVKDYDFSKIIKIGVIYSHVTSYIECFSGKTTTCFNIPLVWYKVIDCDVDHWKKASKKHGVFDEFFWTLGFIRQLKYLIGKNFFEKDVLFHVLDVNDSFKFRLINVIHEKFYDQVRLGRASSDSRQTLAESEFNEIKDFLLESDIFLRECLWQIEKLYRLPKPKFRFFSKVRAQENGLNQEIEKTLEELKSSVFYGFFVRKYRDYSIYKIGDKYFCVLTNSESSLEEEIEYVDPISRPPYLFVSSSIEESLRLVDTQPASSISLQALPSTKTASSAADPVHILKVRERRLENYSYQDLHYLDLALEKDYLLKQYALLIAEKSSNQHYSLGYVIARKTYRILKKAYYTITT